MDNLSIKNYMGIILKKWYIVVISMILFVGVGYSLAKFSSSSSNYRASTSVITYHKTKNGLKKISVSDGSEKKSEKYIIQNKADLEMSETYRSIVTSDTVLKSALKNLKSTKVKTIDSLKGKLSVQANEKSLVLNISANSDSPKDSVKIANAVAEAYKTTGKDVLDIGNVKVLKKARNSNVVATSSSNTKKYTLLSVCIGLYVGCMIAILTTKKENK